MNATTSIRKVGVATVLDLSWDILSQRNCRLVEAVNEQLRLGDKNIVLNLDRVTHISSRGLANLVTAKFSVQKAGGRLRLIVPRQGIRQVFEITYLAPFFEIFGNERDALAGPW